jgi:hypothetical protein
MLKEKKQMISGYRFGALLIVCALLGSCSSPGHFEPTPIVGSGAAMMYLYRPAASNPGTKPLLLSYPEVMIDGVSHGVLKYKSYRAIELPPGKHDVRLTGLTENSKWEPRDVNYSINLKPGETIYMKFRVEFDTDAMGFLELGPKYIIGLNPVPESTAVYEIRDTKKT